MKIEPEDLLACAECMTQAQKASFCELMDPVQPMSRDYPEQHTASRPDPNAKRRTDKEVLADAREQFERELDAQRRTSKEILIRAREKLEQKLGAQGGPPYRPPGPRAHGAKPAPGAIGPGMVGWVLGRWRGDHEAHMGVQAEPLALMPPSAVDSPDAPDKLQDRWDLAQARWQRTFGEDSIPMRDLRLESSATALDTVEGMIYDKTTKGRDPERCSCGCGYVIGCQGYQVRR